MINHVISAWDPMVNLPTEQREVVSVSLHTNAAEQLREISTLES